MSADDLDMEHHYDDPSSNTCKTCLQLKHDEDENDYIITQANRFYFHPYSPITEPIGGKRMRRRRSGTKKRRMRRSSAKKRKSYTKKRRMRRSGTKRRK
jgi:hypothetical protein